MRSINYAFIFVGLFIFSQRDGVAQSGPATLPKMIPPTPNAAALGEYGQVPVGLYTGTVQQDIPLYEIKSSDYSLPISLSYRSNGLRVTDNGSDVGLGWVLNTHGVITRALNDERDEYNSTRLTLPQADMDSQTMNNFLYQATSNNTQDDSPDIFSFNFGRYAGKFYLSGTPPNMQAVLIDPSPLKIEFLSDFYTDNINTINPQIRITDPEGVVYSFGAGNAIETSFSKTYGSGNSADNPQSPNIKNAWYLNKITLLNGDEINYTYSSKSLIYDAGISQTASSAVSYQPSVGYVYSYANHPLPKITKVTSTTVKLTDINWKTGKISLFYSLRFSGVTDFEKVDKIIVYTKTNSGTTTPIKQYLFNYLTVDAAYNNPDNNGSFSDNSKRLFLSSLVATSPANNELNRHTFEYYNTNLNELPNRMSYAQDYWGYFNGKVNPDLVTNDILTYNPDYYNYNLNAGRFTKDMAELSFKNVGGDKTPDWQYARRGMLKKIIYPTGGYSILDYEGHDYRTYEMIALPTYKQLVNISDPGTMTFTTGIIPFDQKRIQLNIQNSVVVSSCGPPSSWPNNTMPYDVEVSIKEVQSNMHVPIEWLNNNVYYKQTSPIMLKAGPYNEYYVNFEKGKSYTIKIDVLTSCTQFSGQLSLAYYAVDGTYAWVTRPVGGCRLAKITTGDLTGQEQIKKYYYGTDLSCLTCTTGKSRQVEPSVSYYEKLEQQNNEEVATLSVNLTSNPLHDLYDNQGYHISYSTVIEGIGNSFEGGAIVHNFNNPPEIPPYHYRNPVVGTPFSNVFGSGDEVKTSFYKNNSGTFVKVKDINRTYVIDNRIANSITGFKATKKTFVAAGPIENYNLSVYTISSQWHYLSTSSEITYDQNGNNGSSVANFYEYGNTSHLQVTATSTILENAGGTGQRAFYTKTKFPMDYSFPSSVSGPAAVLKTMATVKHIWSTPVEQLKYTIIGTDYRLTGGEVSTFKMNGNIVTKDKDFTLKFNNSTVNQDYISFTPSTIVFGGVFFFDSHYEILNTYGRYDTYNNLLEVTDRKTVTSLIREPNTGNIWATFKNSSYTNVAYTSFEHETSQVPSFTNFNYNVAAIVTSDFQNGTKGYNLAGNPITTTQTLTTTQKYKATFWRKTGSGTTLSLGGGGAIVNLRTGPQRNGWQLYEATFYNTQSFQISGNGIIDEVRLYPISSRVDSYVYKDGVGITSQCNENNQNTFFEYDEFNRLRLVKDQSGNILKKNEYKYQYIQN